MSEKQTTINGAPTSGTPKRAWTILGRLTTAVREQNWFAVVLEVLIVVLGVVIGFQVTAWGEARTNHAREQLYLTQLLEDFAQTEEALEWSLAFAEQRLEQSVIIQSMFEGALADSIDARELAISIGVSHWLTELPLPRDTWSDLVSSGRLELIRNRDLRWTISAFYRSTDSQSNYNRDWVRFVDPYRRQVVAILPLSFQQAVAKHVIDQQPLPDSLIPTRASLIEAVRTRPALRETFGEVLTTNWTATRQYRELLDRARHVTEQLRTELGKD